MYGDMDGNLGNMGLGSTGGLVFISRDGYLAAVVLFCSGRRHGRSLHPFAWLYRV